MRRRGKRKPERRDTRPKHRINRFITAAEVRVVGENIDVGIYPIKVALNMADDQELDLVEISPNAKPPVCKIIDYKKFLYDTKKREKELKAKQQKTVIKEIRFTPNTDDHDFEFKARNAERFLKEGAKVKCYVQFKGRNILFKDRGELILLRFAQRLEEWGELENMPKVEGRRMLTFIVPKKK